MTVSDFSGFGFCRRILRALEDERYHTPTPVQARAIPYLLDGEDLLGLAQTGTGKTAAFTLPLIENLISHGGKPSPNAMRALILVPTRELALQVADSIKTYGRHVRLRHTVIMGGVSQRAQVNAMRRGTDILIATTGRLLDLVNQGHVRLDTCEYLVLDEADRMLDMGFIRDVRKIVAMLPRERQTALFSATMPKEIGQLASEVLDQPRRVEVASKTVAVDRIDQCVHHLDTAQKRERLVELLAPEDVSRVIVFTRTKRGADNVAKRLNREGINVDAIHGNKSQNARQRALQGFRSGSIRVLVATDIAARGIDVDGISHVINFELPHEPESYVHRIGRTARAGADGIAISFCDASERSQLRAIERLIKHPLRVVGDGPVGDERPRPANNQRRGGPKRHSPRPAKRRRTRRPGRQAA